jgi:hypothetical protein
LWEAQVRERDKNTVKIKYLTLPRNFITEDGVQDVLCSRFKGEAVLEKVIRIQSM